jgi:hypothetical protein
MDSEGTNCFGDKIYDEPLRLLYLAADRSGILFSCSELLVSVENGKIVEQAPRQAYCTDRM